MIALGEADRRHLERAVGLGTRGWGGVQPNPLVGCVLVRDGTVVGEGWHELFGGPHAEVRALEAAGEAARGATAYVSLEPCPHEGKTPPCTRALVEAGVARVVYGAADPGAASAGGGDRLREAGLEVVGPVFDDDRAWRENPAFHHVSRHGTPFVAVKLAVSLDGGIAAAPGLRTTLTGPEAQDEVHRLRAGFDAVLVGGETAWVDDPRLTVRRPVPMRRPPVRIVLDGSGRLSPGAALFEDADAPVRVYFREGRDAPGLAETGATVVAVPAGPGGEGVALDAVLRDAWDAGLRSILCEGGGRVAAAFLGSGLAPRLYLFLAPRVLGPDAVPAFPGLDATDAASGWTPAGEPRRFGDDTLVVLDRPHPR